MTETYTPKPGDQVRVRRYQVPCPELPGIAERKMIAEHTGTVGKVRKVPGGVLFQLEGFGHDIFTGYQFSGQDPDHGCSWSLHTEVVPLADVAAHDQAGLDATVAQAEREAARALSLWERARDAEVAARQRLTGAQERLEAATGRAGTHRRQGTDLGALTERRKADRAVMAAHVADLARSHGLSAHVTVDEAIRQASVDLSGPHTLGLTVRFRGSTPQCEPDTYVLSWHMRPWADEGKGWELNPDVFDAVNPYHGTKATDVANGFRELCELLTRRFAAIEDGSAFIAPEPAST